MQPFLLRTALLLGMLSASLPARSADRDSLLRATRSPVDTLRIQAWIGLARAEETAEELDASQGHAVAAGQLADRIGYLWGAASARFCLGAINDKKNWYEAASSLYRRGLALAQAAGRPDLEGYGCIDYALVLKRQNKHQEALRYNERARRIYEQLDDSNYLASVYINMGNNYKNLNLFEQSVAHNLKALKISEALGHDKEVAKVLNNIGVVYDRSGNYRLALDYYQRMQAPAKRSGNRKILATAYQNIGSVYQNMKVFDTALYYDNLAVAAHRALDNAPFLLVTLTNRATSLNGLGRYHEAVRDASEALQLAHDQDDPESRGYAWASLGDAYRGLERFGESRAALDSAYALSQSLPSLPLALQTLEGQEKLALVQAHYKDAYAYKADITRQKDSLLDADKLERMQALQVQYETEQKEKALLQSQAVAARNGAAVQRQRGIIWGGAAGLLLVSAVGVLGVRNARLRRIRGIQAAQLDAIRARQQMQEERLRIGRELHDNIGSQLTLVASSLQSGSQAPERLQEAGALTLQAIRDLRSTVWLIHHESCTTEELVVKLREYLRPASGAGVQVTVELLGDGAAVLSSKASTHLLRIVQEGVNNALKYSGADSIRVALDNRRKDLLEVCVADNGRGFNAASVGDGFGLQNMRARAAELNGSYRLDTAPGRGTQIRVAVPLPA